MLPAGITRGGEVTQKNNPDEFDRRFQQMQAERGGIPSGGGYQRQSVASQSGVTGVLFYSPYDSRSKQFVEALYKEKALYNSIKMIDVIERKNTGQKIPSIITKVPTLIVNGINNPLVDDAAFHWLNIEKSKGSSSSSQQTPQLSQSPHTLPGTSGGGIACSDGNGFSGWCDSYSQVDPSTACSLDIMYQPLETPKMKAQASRVSSDSKMSESDISQYTAQRRGLP